MYYAAAGVVFLLLKVWHAFADVSDLWFLLKPTNTLFELATGLAATYVPGWGYYHESPGIVINASCSGFNFMLICYAVLAVAAFRHLGSGRFRTIIIPAVLAVAYVLTIFVNAARIVAAVRLGSVFPDVKAIGWAHEALGAFIYLSFLILIYLSANVILSKLTNRDAKPA